MKSLKLFFLVLLLFNVSCSTDSNNNDNDDDNIIVDTLETEIVISGNQFEIDKPISFNVVSNQNLNEVSISYNNWESSFGLLAGDESGLGLSKTVFTSFDTLGTKTIYVRTRNLENEVDELTFQIEITRGSSVKINRVNIISFSNINGIWDPELSGDDELADLKFAFTKNVITSSFDSMEYSIKTWYLSEVLMNQGNLTWDLNNEELYIDPNLTFAFGLGDDDGGGIGQDLLLGPPFEIPYYLQEVINEEPSSITLINEDIDLEVQFELEW